jgi:phage terminase large subunit-like protein
LRQHGRKTENKQLHATVESTAPEPLGSPPPWLFKGKRGATRGERNIAWCEEYLHIPEGKHVGDKMRVPEFIREDFRQIYDNPNGTRRAIICRGRKNAKTTEAAILTLLHLCGPEAATNQSAQIYSDAQSRDQAGLLFNLAIKMIQFDRRIFRYITIRETLKTLVCKPLNTTYRALSAEASTAFGLSPSLVIHDELGQVRGPRSAMYEALETATAAQANPLSIIISTQAPTDADLLSVLIDDAMAGHDPHTVIRFDHTPLDVEDPFSEKAIRAANPGFDVFMNQAEVKGMAENARRMPAREAQYRNLVLNQRVEASNPFVSRNVWKDCGAEPKILPPGTVCYAGLDLSSVADLTAFVLIGQVGGVWQVHPTFWLPGEGLADKARTDHVPYDLWEKQGFLKTTPGNSVEYEFVAKFLREQFFKYSIRKLAFDRWNMKHLKPWLEKAGFGQREIEEKFIEFGQGTQSMSPALRELESTLLDKKLAHGNHPVLSMCAACAVVEGKDDANRKLSKNRSSGRIDGMIALTMAMGVAAQVKEFDLDTLIA